MSLRNILLYLVACFTFLVSSNSSRYLTWPWHCWVKLLWVNHALISKSERESANRLFSSNSLSLQSRGEIIFTRKRALRKSQLWQVLLCLVTRSVCLTRKSGGPSEPLFSILCSARHRISRVSVLGLFWNTISRCHSLHPGLAFMQPTTKSSVQIELSNWQYYSCY